MSAGPPHAPGPGDARPVERDDESNALSGGTQGILAVTLATLALALTAAAVSAVVSWLV